MRYLSYRATRTTTGGKSAKLRDKPDNHERGYQDLPRQNGQRKEEVLTGNITSTPCRSMCMTSICGIGAPYHPIRDTVCHSANRFAHLKSSNSAASIA